MRGYHMCIPTKQEEPYERALQNRKGPAKEPYKRALQKRKSPAKGLFPSSGGAISCVGHQFVRERLFCIGFVA